MAVAAFDSKFSFEQAAIARIGEDGSTKKLTEEQMKKLAQSSAMQLQRKIDELTQQYTDSRDFERASSDTFFKPTDADWTAAKAYDFKRNTDYYNILGLDDEYASNENVKAAYKKLSLIYHPDKTKGLDKEQQEAYATVFISVKNAYLVLGDQATRRQYDRERDHDRAKAVINGTPLESEKKGEGIDLTEVLARIEEMRKPPGKIVEIPLEAKLEKFFYGGRKQITRKRQTKDFYLGFIKDDFTYRAVIPRAAEDPFNAEFKEGGDWHKDTKPDTVLMKITAEPHDVVDRDGPDLILKKEIDLDPETCATYITAETPSLRGRHILLWGRNPMSTSGGALAVRMLGEGLAASGFLRFTCRVQGRKTAAEKGFKGGKQGAKDFLKAVVAAHQSWQSAAASSGKASISELYEALIGVLRKRELFDGSSPGGGLQEWISQGIRETAGEWSLHAQVAAALSEGEGATAGTRPSLKRFLERNGLTRDGGLEAPGSEDEASTAEAEEKAAFGKVRRRKAAAQQGGLAASAAGRVAERLLARSQQYEVELSPLGEPVLLFTQPTCSLQFYCNFVREDSEASAPPPGTIFAVCISSSTCQRKKMAKKWSSLKEAIVPLVQASAFKMLEASRFILPRPLRDFTTSPTVVCDEDDEEEVTASGLPGLDILKMARAFERRHAALEKREAESASIAVPWKRLGGEAFRRGDFFAAMAAYTRCIEEAEGDEAKAVAFSNRAACLAKVGFPEDSLEDAKKALELRPNWGRAWARIGTAHGLLGEEHQQEALEACFKAVEFDPVGLNVEVLSKLAKQLIPPSKEGCAAEKEKGNAALREKSYGLAVAHYTVALATLPEEDKGFFKMMTSVFLSNRASVYLQLKNWKEARIDGDLAMKAKPDYHKAHVRLGSAYLAVGEYELAYTEFAWALSINGGLAVAQMGQQACITGLQYWTSEVARKRLARFGLDRGRPKETTRIWAISDVNFDHRPNEEWTNQIDNFEFQEDVLILAGNLGSSLFSTTKALKAFKSRFRRIFFVPGNFDLWMNQGEVRMGQFPDSLAKLFTLLDRCDQLGIDVCPAAVCQDLCIAPLLSWYNPVFDRKTRPDPNHQSDQVLWPIDGYSQVWKYFLKLNEAVLELPYRGTVISFSHFLPLSNLPFDSDNRAGQAMGCEDLEDQIRMVRSTCHVYGHSTVRTQEDHGGIMFVNNYHGYTNGKPEGVCKPQLIYDGAQGGLVVEDFRKQREQF